MRTFGWVVLCLCLFAGVGWYLEWFNFSASVNKGKIKEDVDTVKEKIHGRDGEKTVESK